MTPSCLPSSSMTRICRMRIWLLILGPRTGGGTAAAIRTRHSYQSSSAGTFLCWVLEVRKPPTIGSFRKTGSLRRLGARWQGHDTPSGQILLVSPDTFRPGTARDPSEPAIKADRTTPEPVRCSRARAGLMRAFTLVGCTRLVRTHHTQLAFWIAENRRPGEARVPECPRRKRAAPPATRPRGRIPSQAPGAAGDDFPRAQSPRWPARRTSSPAPSRGRETWTATHRAPVAKSPA